MLEDTGERQVKTFLKDVDKGHKERYIFATNFIKQGMNVGDIGCGIGYGSYYMAIATPCKSVTGVDIASDAIEYAKEHYSNEKTKFLVKDIIAEMLDDKFDLITAFEVIEHTPNAKAFLSSIVKLLNEDGIIVLSSPNEDVLHFKKELFPFHIKHYTVFEFEHFLDSVGLEPLIKGSQNDRGIYAFPGNGFHVYVCRKKGSRVTVETRRVIEDNIFNRAMAAFEQIDWYLKNGPEQSYNTSLQQLIHARQSLEEAQKVIISGLNKHRRLYNPAYFEDNPCFQGIVGEMFSGDIISQRFKAGENGLCGIAVLPGVYGAGFVGTVVLMIKSEEGVVIGCKAFSSFIDNILAQVDFMPVNRSKDKTYVLEIQAITLGEQPKLTFYQTEEQEDHGLKVNGEKRNGKLTYRLFYL